MVDISMKQRIGILLSAVWLLVVLMLTAMEAGSRLAFEELIPFIGFGVLPVVVGWGVWWVLRGRTKTKPGEDS